MPDLYSKPLDFARPICLTDELPAVNIVPLEPVSALCNNTCLNASVVVPEDTKPTSVNQTHYLLQHDYQHQI